jgi:hypothetical protein
LRAAAGPKVSGRLAKFLQKRGKSRDLAAAQTIQQTRIDRAI